MLELELERRKRAGVESDMEELRGSIEEEEGLREDLAWADLEEGEAAGGACFEGGGSSLLRCWWGGGRAREDLVLRGLRGRRLRMGRSRIGIWRGCLVWLLCCMVVLCCWDLLCACVLAG